MLLLDVLAILDGEIETQLQRRHSQLQNYEKRKARGQCAAKASCKFTVVPGYTCCAYHLRKSAEATARHKRLSGAAVI
jgi:hypothetical protein